MGDTSLGQLALIKEVTPGTTPATPAFSIIDFVSEDLAATGQQFRSNTVNLGRVIKSSRRTSIEVGGGFTCELTNDLITNSLWEALLGNPFATNVAKLGGSTLSAFTIERKLLATDYRRFVGARVNALELSIQPEKEVVAKWGMIGLSMTTGAALIAGATYTQPGTNEKLTGLDVGTIAMSNGVTGSFDYSNLSLTIGNNMATTKRVGASPVRGVVAGLGQITGKLDIYIEDKSMADAFIAETPFDLTIPILNNAKGYTLALKKVKCVGYSDPNPGNAQSFIASLDIEATLDAAYTSSFGVTKAD
jgi:Phage tail tube protein